MSDDVAVRCHCGDCSVRVPHRAALRNAVRCHCAHCRKYHTSAFGTFLPLEGADAQAVLSMLAPPAALRFPHYCDALGTVDRVVCRACRSAVATVAAAPPGPADPPAATVLVSLGCVEDESLPAAIAAKWQTSFDEWQPESRCVWWSAQPRASTEAEAAGSAMDPSEVTGSCACGACAYRAKALPGQIQHCYCTMCRRFSGSVAQSWMPVRNQNFHWSRAEGLALVRTTSFGQRHMCTRCGAVLTIVYDSQPDTTWLAAGALDDCALPALPRPLE
eukprot:EG_transcript_21068